MPTIEASYKDLTKMIGKKLNKKQMETALMFVKGEIDFWEKDELKIDIKETNRPDLWSSEGIAREIKKRLGLKKGLQKHKVVKGKTTCTIEKSVTKIRPFISCAVVRNVTVTDEWIRQMVQLQEKIGTTFGRKRKETGIGLYDFDIMKPPIFYKGFKDKEIEFIPLEYKIEMRPSEILKEHPKGKEFAHLLEGVEKYPIVIDSTGTVASMPPIINSETTGKVTEKTKNIFLEVTGNNWETVNTALKVMCMALADRGGKIETVKMQFPKGKPYPSKSEHTPNFGSKKISFELSLIKKVSGLNLTNKQVLGLLSKAGMNSKIKGKKIEIEYPDYRLDIMHPVDIIEDILIGYGYNEIKPEPIKMTVIGQERKETTYLDKVRDVCVGLGLQEILTFNLTSIEKQGKKIGFGEEKFVEIANPVSSEWSVLRKRIIPEHLEFLEKNKRYEYPQKIFEVGKILELNPKSELGVKEHNSVCITIADKKADYNMIKMHLDALTKNMNWKYSLKKKNFDLFETGLGAEISLNSKKGLIGVLSKTTMQKFNLKEKTIVLELNF